MALTGFRQQSTPHGQIDNRQLPYRFIRISQLCTRYKGYRPGGLSQVQIYIHKRRVRGHRRPRACDLYAILDSQKGSLSQEVHQPPSARCAAEMVNDRGIHPPLLFAGITLLCVRPIRLTPRGSGVLACFFYQFLVRRGNLLMRRHPGRLAAVERIAFQPVWQGFTPIRAGRAKQTNPPKDYSRGLLSLPNGATA